MWAKESVRFIKESVIRATPERVFAFHELPDVMTRLLPPWERARIIEAAPNLRAGAHARIETKLFGLYTVRWEALHTAYDPPRMFEDIQTRGPFRSWRHRHIIEPHELGAVLRDDVEYEPFGGIFGRWAAPFLVAPRLERLFAYRHEVTRRWCERREEGTG